MNITTPIKKRILDVIQHLRYAPCKEGSETGFRIDAAQLCGLDQRQDAGGALAAFIGPANSQFLRPGLWALGSIAVDLDGAVVD